MIKLTKPCSIVRAGGPLVAISCNQVTVNAKITIPHFAKGLFQRTLKTVQVQKLHRLSHALIYCITTMHKNCSFIDLVHLIRSSQLSWIDSG